MPAVSEGPPGEKGQLSPRRGPAAVALAFFAVGVVGLLGTFYTGWRSEPVTHGKGGPAIGQLAPDFDLPRCDGGRVRLSSLRGHQVLLVFYRTHT